MFARRVRVSARGRGQDQYVAGTGPELTEPNMFEADVKDPTGAEDEEEEEEEERGEVRHGTMREGAGNTMKAEAERNSTQSACCPWGRHRKHRKPPSNPPGWSEGKSTAYDVAQRPNRVVVINAEQVRSLRPAGTTGATRRVGTCASLSQT